MALTTPVTEIRDRCKSGWATLGVVSALLAGLSIIPPLSAQSTVGLDPTIDAWTSAWLVGLLYVSFLAFMANITVIICTSLFYIYIDHIFTREAIKEFLRDWLTVLLAIPFIFTTSVLLVVIEVLMVVGYTCHRYHIWVLVGIAGGVVVSLIGLTLSVALWVGRRAANLYVRTKQQQQQGQQGQGQRGKAGGGGKEEGAGGGLAGGGGGSEGTQLIGFGEQELGEQGEGQGMKGAGAAVAVAEAVEREGRLGGSEIGGMGAGGGSGGGGRGGGARVRAQLGDTGGGGEVEGGASRG
ncbi:hypothetical protein HXX76_014915 [Chlamydomonas incerta]|uniref:Transmembrane protein n=1 Tax=Chlamydomonas incerta TaxID=51695 RepID=A0A835SEB5_CHLIN|nr:hypothetical protein HXX76_014915 [Chlamydomonas incerta]|eukprot:KAG2423976.1 hypothetical protein HXX76_014915 [Chlamydomonas incerta]